MAIALSGQDPIALSYSTWHELWKECRQQARSVDPEDEGDRLAKCPPQLATGYKRDITLRNGIDLTLHRYELQGDLMITQVQPTESECLEFVFNLSSTFRYWTGANLASGQYCVQGVFNPASTEGFAHFAQEPTLEVDIHLEPEVLRSLFGMDTDSQRDRRFDLMSSELKRLLAGDPEVFLSPIQDITPTMQVALQQILNCPYHGVVKQLYLESKSIEVLALWLEQALSGTSTSEPSMSALRSDEVDRIYQAKEILIQQMHNPPSLIALARQVGLNDCTLKRKFRQVFGTTVFGYLHHHRMEQARSLLLDQHQLTVTAIAHQVGYNNLCAFSTAFRKKFGMSPREMRS